MATAIVEDMKELAEDMLAASDMRLRAVGSLVATTRETLRKYHTDRHKMAASQAKDLAGFASGLSKDVHEIRRKAQNLIKEFNKTGRQMSTEQSNRLAGFVQGLAQDVTAMLSRFEKDRRRMSKELEQRLAQEIGDIKTAVEQTLKETESLMHEQHSGMVKARHAWQDACAAIARARAAGHGCPVAETGHKPRAAKRPAHRTPAKKNPTKKHG
jgi:DNA repair exonuclease SbcCD ATPase subunit